MIRVYTNIYIYVRLNWLCIGCLSFAVVCSWCEAIQIIYRHLKSIYIYRKRNLSLKIDIYLSNSIRLNLWCCLWTSFTSANEWERYTYRKRQIVNRIGGVSINIDVCARVYFYLPCLFIDIYLSMYLWCAGMYMWFRLFTIDARKLTVKPMIFGNFIHCTICVVYST